MKTNVNFLIEKDSEDNEVFAFFPDEYFNLDLDPDMRTCYAHIGQHSACSYAYASECKQATPEQYEGLLNELTSLGYDLNVWNENKIK